jgi:site-specific DNA-methyltransferase (adenine-specific)
MKPYFERDGISLYLGDSFEVLPSLDVKADLVLTDPCYGETSLDWDHGSHGWLALVRTRLAFGASVWFFASIRYLLSLAEELEPWKLVQDLVWEKHNGSNFHSDRFKRVHELLVHVYFGPWEDIYKNPVTTPDATARVTRRKERPAHTGQIGSSTYVSEDGGPRLMRSVIYARNCHGYAVHPTQKPRAILEPPIIYSCRPGGLVLDIYAGSGSTLVTAAQLGRRAIGIEIDERRCEIAAKHIESELAQLPLFRPQARTANP